MNIKSQKKPNTMRTLFSKLDLSEKLLILSLSLFTILRFPSLFEPYWYGDEGIYQIIAKAMNNGRDLYVGIWDNKPPLLFYLYALTQGDQFTAKLFSLIFGIGIICIFYALSKRIFTSHKTTGIVTLVFSVLFATPYLEGNIANTENFMLLPILIGMFLFFSLFSKHTPKTPRFIIKDPVLTLFGIGLLFGLSFSMKVVGIFEFAAASVLILFTAKSLPGLIKKGFTLTLGFVTPILFFALLYLSKGLFEPFSQAVLTRNVSYVGVGNYFLFPQGLLVLKLILLIGSLVALYKFRKRIPFALTFLLVWLGFALFSSFLSQRPYTHYVLLSLPVVVLLGGYLVTFLTIKKHLYAFGLYILLVGFLLFHFNPYSLVKTVLYYPNFIQYITGFKDVNSYQAFFDGRTPRDYKIAEYLDLKLESNEEVFIWGNSAQIYVLSDTLPVGRFGVAYHILTYSAFEETQKAIDTQKPRFVVIMEDEPFQNISLKDYTYRMSLDKTIIYERTN